LMQGSPWVPVRRLNKIDFFLDHQAERASQAHCGQGLFGRQAEIVCIPRAGTVGTIATKTISQTRDMLSTG
jgi:hypothetical protein